MKRNVGLRASVYALIGITLSLMGCGKQASNESGLPTPSASLSSVTTAFNPVVMVGMPNGSGICSGTFVSTKAVLTASHCTKDESGNALTGRYTVYLPDGSMVSTYTTVSYGPGVVNDPNDIALLVFDTDVVDASAVYSIANGSAAGDTLQLVGFGCTNITTKVGAGVKRTGSNVISSIDDYINFLTPSTSSSAGILGASNRAGSCFGDSGGPALKTVGGQYQIAGVTHAGGTDGSDILSEYVDVSNRSDNRNWLSQQNQAYGLNIQGL